MAACDTYVNIWSTSKCSTRAVFFLPAYLLLFCVFCSQDGGEIDQESERAVCKALVVSIVAKVTKEKANVSTEEQFMALCRDVGMQMGLTKVFFQQKAFNSIERLRWVGRTSVFFLSMWRTLEQPVVFI